MSRSKVTKESTLTDLYQTTIPEAIRAILHLEKRDKTKYTIESNGRVYLTKINKNNNDPVLQKFLDFIEADIEQNPQNVHAFTTELTEEAQSLISDLGINMDEDLID